MGSDTHSLPLPAKSETNHKPTEAANKARSQGESPLSTAGRGNMIN